MSALGLVTAVSQTNMASHLGKVQLAVAGKMLEIANAQGEAVLGLIEAAADGMSAASAELASAIGELVDIQA